MHKITFCLALLLLCLSNNLSSQDYSKAQLSGADRLPNTERCGTHEYMLQRFAEDPSAYARYQEMQAILYPASNGNANRINCTAANSVRIPLAFHFDNSFDCGDASCILSEIQDAITALNIDYASNTSSPNAANCPGAYPDISTGTCIEFYLAAPPACSGLDVNCDGAITVGQFAGGYSGGGNGAGACWDDYLNIFVQSAVSGNLGVADQIPDALAAAGPGEGVSLGSPYFGGLGGPCGAIDTDNTFNLGKTLSHEIGHYLGLFHTFQGGCGDEPNNSFNGTAINVNDTPAQQSQFFGCPTGCTASGCGSGNQQTANIMNYTNDACMDMFSEDQAFAMNTVARGLFGGLNIPDANPSELYGACTNNTCNVVCPTTVQTAYAGNADVCAGVGTYTLPSTYTGLVLDNSGSATYAWSTGSYISAGGTALTNTTITLTNPAGCSPVPQRIFLNVACADGSIADIDAGEFTLNVYPDATQFTAADLVTVSGENTCNEPVLTANCAGVTITADAANPAFPVASGQNGAAAYTVTYNAPAGTPNCCTGGGGAGGEIVTNGDFEGGTTGWTEVEEVPSGTINPNPFGVIGVSNGQINGSNDAWFGGWGGTSTITISQSITIPPTCGEANLTFDFLMSCAGDAGITLDVAVNGIVLGTLSCADGASGTIAAFDLIAAGAATGNVTLSFIGTEDGTGTGEPDIYIDNVSIVTTNCSVAATCENAITANYNCAGCTDCNDAACITTQICNDADPCTENDMETVLTAGGICVPCAGTPIASCSGTTSVVACNDGDPCTTNDVQTVDDCDSSICVPCAGTAVAACSQTTTQTCDDNDSCTINDVVVVDACTGAICVPCSGTFNQASCCGDVNLDINFDNNPIQNSWDIVDGSGNVVASGGTYGSQTGGSNLNMSPVACLPDGCYTLNFYDSANDGMCPRRTSTITSIGIATLGLGGLSNGSPRIAAPMCGNYTLTDGNGTGLASGGGRFGTSETNSFCLVNGVAQFNYQPDNVYGKQSTSNDNGSSMWLTPTLTSDRLMVYTSLNNAAQAQINVVDMNGRIMQQHSQDSNSSGEMQLNVSDLPAGIYFVQVVANGTVLVEKFVKK